uniref:Uncharacterized protein n=1 Tax=Candidatus Methanophagaceae archaeon ANME-1 ERB6 TaxID=2759912 RepID=A0A7G9YV22_9EURY|nr:hypothetical protein PAJCOBIN_00016 [Methanosarcinales archaeon ANME-1 ERB6]
MEHKKRRILCVGVLATLLLSIAVTGVAVSQPLQKENAMGKVAKAMSAGGVAEEVSTNRAQRAPIRIIHSGYGFAINEDDEFHVLRVHIVKRRFFQPRYIRELMGEDTNIEELKAKIEGAGGRPIYQGHLRLGENHYRLVNMSVDANGAEGNRVFDADIVGPLRNLEPSENMSIAGHISMTVMRYEGARIGEGELTMSEGDYTSEYSVLLDMRPLGQIQRKETNKATGNIKSVR